MFYFLVRYFFLDHALDELVDLLSAVSSLSAFKEVNKLGLVRKTTTGAGELERPQEVVRFLEAWPYGVYFVDEICTALYSNGPNALLDDGVVSNGNALFVELAKSTLVDELLNSRTSGIAIGNIRFNKAKHANCRLIELDEGGIVDLSKAEKLHDLLGLGRNSNSTPNANNQSELGHGRNVEPTLCLRLATVGNRGLLCGLVLGTVLLSGSNGILLILTLLLLGVVRGLLRLLGELGLGSLLLEHRLGDLEGHRG